MSEPTVKIDPWTLEWLLVSAKRELKTVTDEAEKYWLEEVIKRGDKAWHYWMNQYDSGFHDS